MKSGLVEDSIEIELTFTNGKLSAVSRVVAGLPTRLVATAIVPVETQQTSLVTKAIFSDSARSPVISQMANQVAKQLLRS